MMTNSQISEMKQFIEYEMKNHPENYMDAFDLAVECCSYLCLWEEDKSIPKQVVDLCEKYVPMNRVIYNQEKLDYNDPVKPAWLNENLIKFLG